MGNFNKSTFHGNEGKQNKSRLVRFPPYRFRRKAFHAGKQAFLVIILQCATEHDINSLSLFFFCYFFFILFFLFYYFREWQKVNRSGDLDLRDNAVFLNVFPIEIQFRTSESIVPAATITVPHGFVQCGRGHICKLHKNKLAVGRCSKTFGFTHVVRRYQTVTNEILN